MIHNINGYTVHWHVIQLWNYIWGFFLRIWLAVIIFQKFKFLFSNLSARIHSGNSCNYRRGALPQHFGKTWSRTLLADKKMIWDLDSIIAVEQDETQIRMLASLSLKPSTLGWKPVILFLWVLIPRNSSSRRAKV